MAKTRQRASTPTPAAPDRNWEAESDFRTLQGAEEVRMNGPRLTAARRIGRRQMRATARVLGRPR